MDFFRNNKKKVAGVAFVALVFYTWRRLRPYWSQIRQMISMMRELAANKSGGPPVQAKNVLQHRLDRNLSVGDVTLRHFAPHIRDKLVELLNVEEVRNTMASDPKKKKDPELWNKFKVLGFARTLAAVYSLCLLNVLLKLQVNIASRYSLFEGPVQQKWQLELGEELNKRFFRLSEYAQKEGLAVMCTRLSTIVHTHLAQWDVQSEDDLKKSITFPDLEKAVNRIRDEFESGDEELATRNPFLDYLLSPEVHLPRNGWEGARAWRTAHTTALAAARAANTNNNNDQKALEDKTKQKQKQEKKKKKESKQTDGGAEGSDEDEEEVEGEGERRKKEDMEREVKESDFVSANERLGNMTWEVFYLLDTHSFWRAAKCSADLCFSQLMPSLKEIWKTDAVPVPLVITRMSKLFNDYVLPTAQENSVVLSALSSESQLLRTDDAEHGERTVRGLCEVVFYPLAETIAPSPLQ